ncbi:MAG: hypothetical protein WBO88_04950, partial [Candidatus Dechloromonas phosphoritropha]
MHRITLGAAFDNDRLQQARRVAGLSNGHGNPHGSAAGGVDPRVVGNGPGKGDLRLGVEVVFEDAAVEGLFQAVGGNEAEAFDLAVASEAGGVVPPIHDEIGRFGYLGPGGAQGFGVA